jgi:hypothetical protein
MTNDGLWFVKNAYEQILHCEQSLRDLEKGEFNELIPDAHIKELFISSIEDRKQQLIKACPKEYAEKAMRLVEQIENIQNCVSALAQGNHVTITTFEPHTYVDLDAFPEIYQIVYNLLSDKLSDLKKEFEEL